MSRNVILEDTLFKVIIFITKQLCHQDTPLMRILCPGCFRIVTRPSYQVIIQQLVIKIQKMILLSEGKCTSIMAPCTFVFGHRYPTLSALICFSPLSRLGIRQGKGGSDPQISSPSLFNSQLSNDIRITFWYPARNAQTIKLRLCFPHDTQHKIDWYGNGP